jgi:hypothetical protein
MKGEEVAEALASVCAQFRSKDLNSLLSMLGDVRRELLAQCAADLHDLIQLEYYRTRLTIEDLKGVSALDSEPNARGTLDCWRANPLGWASAMGAYAARCREEGRSDLGRVYLEKVMQEMDAGKHWPASSPDVEARFREQLAQLTAGE